MFDFSIIVFIVSIVSSSECMVNGVKVMVECIGMVYWGQVGKWWIILFDVVWGYFVLVLLVQLEVFVYVLGGCIVGWQECQCCVVGCGYCLVCIKWCWFEFQYVVYFYIGGWVIGVCWLGYYGQVLRCLWILQCYFVVVVGLLLYLFYGQWW